RSGGNPINGATYVLNGVQQIDTTNAGQVTYTDLPPNTNYRGTAFAAGYGQPADVSLSPVIGDDLTSDINLVQLGTITGIVTEKAGDTFTHPDGIVVTATDTQTGQTFTGQTAGGAGQYAITGTTTTEGLTPHHSYDLLITSGLEPGYIAPTTPTRILDIQTGN